jgi:hypothetical protein
MAVEALVRRALEGRPPSPGARAAVRELELDDYQTLFANRTIYTGTRDDATDGVTPLYAGILGTACETLPAAIRQMHDGSAMRTVRGRASVERGVSVLAQLAAAIMGFPKATADTSVSVQFTAAGGEETWTRRFREESFSSIQYAGRGRSQRLLCERFGPLTFAMALVAKDGRLSLVLRCWSAFGIPLPMWLCPRSNSWEEAEADRFRFHVEIRHPLTGLIVRYKGWLEPT